MRLIMIYLLKRKIGGGGMGVDTGYLAAIFD